jgi:hypothetical protein
MGVLFKIPWIERMDRVTEELQVAERRLFFNIRSMKVRTFFIPSQILHLNISSRARTEHP